MAFATTVRDGACQADGRRQDVEIHLGFLCERDQTVRVKEPVSTSKTPSMGSARTTR